MRKFERLVCPAAVLPMVNIDTDLIIPKQFLKTIARTGLGKHLFNDLRYFSDGRENPDFVLNRPECRKAGILIAGHNFGCGSSREHAPWALTDFGIYCVIASGFADIFFNNCFKNGLLPIVLPQEKVDFLAKAAAGGGALAVDLAEQKVTAPDGTAVPFAIDPFRRECLLQGLDDIGLTERYLDDIAAYEAKNP